MASVVLSSSQFLANSNKNDLVADGLVLGGNGLFTSGSVSAATVTATPAAGQSVNLGLGGGFPSVALTNGALTTLVGLQTPTGPLLVGNNGVEVAMLGDLNVNGALTVLGQPIYGFNSPTPAVPLVLGGVAQAGVVGFVANPGNNIPFTGNWTTVFSWGWDTIGGGAFAQANAVSFIISGDATSPYGSNDIYSTTTGVGNLTMAITDQETQFNNGNSPRTIASLGGNWSYQLPNGTNQAFQFPAYGLGSDATPIVTVSRKASPIIYLRGSADGAIVFNEPATDLYLHAVILS
jgi:hypothetical protein